jgi:hypothetical protein
MMKLLKDAPIAQLKDDALPSDDFTNLPKCMTSFHTELPEMQSPLLRRAFSGAFIGFPDQPELDAPSQNLKSLKNWLI